MLVNLHLWPQTPCPGKRPESWSFTWTGSLGGRRTCLRNAGPSRLDGLWARFGEIKVPQLKARASYNRLSLCSCRRDSGSFFPRWNVFSPSCLEVCFRFLGAPFGFPSGASQVAPVVKSPSANAGGIRDAGSVPGSGGSPGGGRGNPLQDSCLESLGRRSLAGCSPWGCRDSDATERPSSRARACHHGLRPPGGVSCLQDSSRGMALNVICSSWEETKAP